MTVNNSLTSGHLFRFQGKLCPPSSRSTHIWLSCRLIGHHPFWYSVVNQSTVRANSFYDPIFFQLLTLNFSRICSHFSLGSCCCLLKNLISAEAVFRLSDLLMAQFSQPRMRTWTAMNLKVLFRSLFLCQ